MHECFDSLSDATTISILDATSRIRPGRKSRAGSRQNGNNLSTLIIMLYENAIWTQKRPRDVSTRDEHPTYLTKVRWHFALVYLDHIVISLQQPHEHIEHVLQTLMLLNDAGMTLDSKKREIFTNPISYPDHAIGQGPSRCRSPRAEAECRLEHTTNLTEAW